VFRYVEAGQYLNCVRCDTRIGFNAKARRALQVIANVYERGVWKRVEHYHDTCYAEAGSPHGKPTGPDR
jgi:hypothetical protein